MQHLLPPTLNTAPCRSNNNEPTTTPTLELSINFNPNNPPNNLSMSDDAHAIVHHMHVQ